MFRSVLVASVLPLFLSFCEASVNYCGTAMCGKTDAHTFCQFPDGPSPTCSGYIDDRLSGEEKARVVARMNHRRSEAAQGKVEHLPPASNMLRLRWVEELAREAQIWADQCQPPGYPELLDACRDLCKSSQVITCSVRRSWPVEEQNWADRAQCYGAQDAITVGQCVASVVGEAPGLRPESMVDMWFLQGRQYRATHFMQSVYNKKSSADFEQMMWAHAYLVGCARSRFMTDIDGRLRTVTRLVCNFAPRGPGGALWTPGAPASACPPRSRPDPSFPALCTFHREVNFTYDVTNTTIVKEQSVLDTILEIEQNDSLNFRGGLDKIYLTKMMVASMKNEAANNSHSVVKKNVAEPIITKTAHLFNTTEENQHLIDEIIEKKLKDTSTARVTKKKISTIGRPKSYNVDDLNTVKEFENGTTRPVEAVKEDDAYRDYDLDEVLISNDVDYNSSITESNGTTGSDNLMENITEMITTTERKTSTTMTPTVTTNSSADEMKSDNQYIDTGENTNASYVQNYILKRLIELSKETENNPYNPETAKQLQEALDQMEHVLASPAPKKVRRELRSQSDDQEGLLSSTPVVPQGKSYGQQLRDIGVPDSEPIMNILSKYGNPLLQKYGSLFTRSAASNTSLSLVLFVVGWVSFTL